LNYQDPNISPKRRLASQISINTLKKWKPKLSYAQKLLICSPQNPMVIVGEIGTGKASFLSTLQKECFNDIKTVVVHLDDQTDVKNLVGTYYVAETEIVYKKGPLAIAAEMGWWVCMKGVDKVADVLNGLQIRDGYLHVLSGEKIK
jgi:midasin (ATPase involved in ribosome maturation)